MAQLLAFKEVRFSKKSVKQIISGTCNIPSFCYPSIFRLWRTITFYALFSYVREMNRSLGMLAYSIYLLFRLIPLCKVYIWNGHVIKFYIYMKSDNWLLTELTGVGFMNISACFKRLHNSPHYIKHLNIYGTVHNVNLQTTGTWRFPVILVYNRTGRAISVLVSRRHSTVHHLKQIC